MIVMEDGSLGVIDFGDMKYSFIIQELATVATDFFY